MKIRTILLIACSALLLCTVSCKKEKKGFSGTSVDLGVSIKWATMNAGASSQGEVGTLMTVTDALAYVLEGKKWQLPTEEQWEDLLNNCIPSFSTTADGNGYLITSENGASIYLPAAVYLCKPDDTGADPKIYFVDLTKNIPSIKSTESTDGTYAIRLVRK